MDPLFFRLRALDLPIHRNSLEKDCMEKSTAFQNHIARVIFNTFGFCLQVNAHTW